MVMAPVWLTVVAWLYLSVCCCSAGIIAYDVAFGRRHQPMAVMNLVFPITALYFGPVALAVYWRMGRAGTRATKLSKCMSLAGVSSAAAASVNTGMQMPGHAHPDDLPGTVGSASAHGPANAIERARPWWVTIAIEVSHCGSGCTLGDVISELVIFRLGVKIAGATLGAEYVGDYILALMFGIIFQYFAIAPMRGLGLKDGLVAAAKADFISLTAFEVGLFGWMAVTAFVLFPAPHQLTPSSAAYWFLMQIGMILGYFTSWPVNVWLVNRGIKVPMRSGH